MVTSNSFGYGTPAIADWNHDGYDDVVITDYNATVGGQTDAGQVILFRGSPTGLTAIGGRVINQNSAGVPDVAEVDDNFGYLGSTTGDFNRDGRPDLAVVTEYESVGADTYAGVFHTFPGTATSIGTTGAKLFTQDTAGIPGAVTANTYFGGDTIWSGDFNGDGFSDLVVPCGYCVVAGINNAGYTIVLRGSASGVTGVGARQIKRSSTPGEADVADTYFGTGY